MSIAISHTTKTYPDLAYEPIATAVLGATYELSVAFVGERRAQQLNEAYRGKTYVPDVLSFPLTDTCGELILCPAVIERDAPARGVTYHDHLRFLFIHGCLHLKGYDHGATMEKLEQRYANQFGIALPSPSA